MSPRVSPKVRAYLLLAGAGLITAFVLQRPEPALLAIPFLLALLVGLSLARSPAFSISLHLSQDRVVEGDTVVVTVALQATTAIPQLHLLLNLPEGLVPIDGQRVVDLTLAAGITRVVPQSLVCQHWGGYELGDVYLRLRDRLGVFVYEVHLDLRQPLRVYPRPEAVRALIQPSETQIFAGNDLSRSKGDGIEFTDVRAFSPGDRVRRVNWPLSTRRGELYVNEFHRERNADIVVLLDTFVDVRRQHAGTHLQAVRGAVALTEHYLQQRDRVGMVSFGGTLRWLRPSMGLVQRYRIIEALIDTDVVLSYAWKKVDVIPRFTLPPQALVIAFTPLLDQRTIDALFDLRARGFDLSIIEVSPVPFVDPQPDRVGDLAFRLWMLEREVIRHRFQQLGVAVGVWEEGEPLQAALAEVQGFRHYARRVHA